MFLERLKIETNDHSHFTNRVPISMNWDVEYLLFYCFKFLYITLMKLSGRSGNFRYLSTATWTRCCKFKEGIKMRKVQWQWLLQRKLPIFLPLGICNVNIQLCQYFSPIYYYFLYSWLAVYLIKSLKLKLKPLITVLELRGFLC